MPTSQELVPVLSAVESLALRLDRLATALERADGINAFTMQAVQILPKAPYDLMLPEASGGFLLDPMASGDLANVTIDVGGLTFKFPSGTTGVVFIPVPPPPRKATLQTTNSTTFPARVMTIPTSFVAAVATLGHTATSSGGGGGVTRGSITNISGTIAAGGTSQQLAAANASRNYLLVVNLSTDTLWLNFGVAATEASPSIPLFAAPTAGAAGGGSFVMEGTFISTDQINIIGATTGDAFAAKEG